MKEEIIKCDYCREVIRHADYLIMSPNEQFGSIDIIEAGRPTNNLTLSFGDFCGVTCLCNYIRRELGHSAEDIQCINETARKIQNAKNVREGRYG